MTMLFACLPEHLGHPQEKPSEDVAAPPVVDGKIGGVVFVELSPQADAETKVDS